MNVYYPIYYSSHICSVVCVTREVKYNCFRRGFNCLSSADDEGGEGVRRFMGWIVDICFWTWAICYGDWVLWFPNCLALWIVFIFIPIRVRNKGEIFWKYKPLHNLKFPVCTFFMLQWILMAHWFLKLPIIGITNLNIPRRPFFFVT